MKFTVDQSMCVGCGLCASLCADVFQLNEDGLAEAFEEASDEVLAEAYAAMESCPVGAISEDE